MKISLVSSSFCALRLIEWGTGTASSGVFGRLIVVCFAAADIVCGKAFG